MRRAFFCVRGSGLWLLEWLSGVGSCEGFLLWETGTDASTSGQHRCAEGVQGLHSSSRCHLFVCLWLEKVGQLLERRRCSTYLPTLLLVPLPISRRLVALRSHRPTRLTGLLFDCVLGRQWPILQAGRHGCGGCLDAPLARARCWADHSLAALVLPRLAARRVDLAGRRLCALSRRAEAGISTLGSIFAHFNLLVEGH